MIEYLKDCLRELYNGAPQDVHDYYLNKLRGRYAMTERYPVDEATRDAYYAIIDAYNAADDIRELLDFHYDEAFVEDQDGYFEPTDKYNELVEAFYKAFETAEARVDALDEE